MSCGTSANAMSLVTQTSRPIRGKGADVMFGLSALSAGSRLQDLTTTTSIKSSLETSFQSYHVAYLTMSNTNTLTFTCLCYSARRDMLDPQTSLDSIFFPIPSFMAKKGLDPDVSMWLPNEADPTYPCDTPFNTFFSCYVIFPPFYPHDASSWGNLHNFAVSCFHSD